MNMQNETRNHEGIKLAIIYYSSTGTIHQLAKTAAGQAEKDGAEVRLRKVAELAPDEAIDQNPAWRRHVDETSGTVTEATPEDLDWADAVLFGTPTRFGNVAAQLKQYLDACGGLWFEGKLIDKVAAGFTSAQNPNGGQESTLLALYNTLYHWGCLIVPNGYTDQVIFQSGGNPYGSSVTVPEEGIAEPDLQTVRHQTRRLITLAAQLREGKAAQTS